MWTWLETELEMTGWPRALVILLDAGAKGILLLALAGCAVLFLRRASAAARHLVWTLALGGLLLLPVVSFIMPKWQLPILPKTAPAAQATPAIEPVDTTPSSLPEPAPVPAIIENTSVPPVPTPEAETAVAVMPESAHSLAFWILLAWCALAALLASPLLAGLAGVAWLRHTAHAFAQGPVTEQAKRLAQSLGLRRSAQVLDAGPRAMPMAGGLLRPAIFLPSEAKDWPAEKLRAVLLHELAHAKRRDCLTHAIARLAASLHWFNPLAWVALHQTRIEREGACDDLVLSAGERPEDYATHLLDIARTMHAKAFTSAAAITMARKGHLEGRLLAVLDAARNRRTLKWWAAALGVTFLLAVAVPLGMMELSAQGERAMGANVVIWQAIMDDSAVQAMGLDQNLAAKKSEYVHCGSSDGLQLLKSLRAARAQGAELFPGDQASWLEEKTREVQMPNLLGGMLHVHSEEEHPGRFLASEQMMINGSATVEMNDTLASINLDVSGASARLTRLPAEEWLIAETKPTFQRFNRSFDLPLGQAMVSLRPLEGNTPKSYWHCIIVQSVAAPKEMSEYLRATTNGEKWLTRGAAGILSEIGEASEWSGTAPKEPKAGEAQVKAYAGLLMPDAWDEERRKEAYGRMKVLEAHATTIMGKTLAHVKAVIEAGTLEAILEAQHKAHESFKRGPDSASRDHAFGKASNSSYDEAGDKPLRLAWWNPAAYEAEEYVFWGSHRKNEPRMRFFLQISEHERDSRLVFFRYENE